MTQSLPLDRECWAVLVLRGWLGAGLPLCTNLPPRALCCGWVCMCVCEGIHFEQWVFKALRTGFPQTIITSTPDTSNFLSWYFFFLFALILFLQTPRGEPPVASLQDRDFLSPVYGVPSQGQDCSYVGPAYSPVPDERSCVKEQQPPEESDCALLT